jgi:pSer/pThr/pTyr-binding forkhead associated (FHA) protein
LNLDPELLGQFRRACGLDGPWGLHLLLGHHEDTPDITYLVRAAPFLVIGRDPKADLVLDDPAVSQRHAYLQVIAGRVLIIDLASRNGLTRDGARYPYVWLDGTQGVGLGPFRMRLGRESTGKVPAWPAQSENPLASHRTCQDRFPGLCIEDLGRSARRPRRVRAVLSLIGRAPACRIRLDDSSVSGFQAALVRTKSGPWVVDLLGRGGLTVNGKAVRLARLSSGDHLGISRFAARVYVTAPGDDPRTSSGCSPRRGEPRLITESRPGIPALRPELTEVAQPGYPPAPVSEDWRAALDYLGEWFGTLFREQAALIRDELAQLVRLNRELAELHGRLSADDRSSRRAAKPSPSHTPLPSPDAIWPLGSVAPPGVHLELIQRIETLQREQRSRWQRLLNLGAGK